MHYVSHTKMTADSFEPLKMFHFCRTPPRQKRIRNQRDAASNLAPSIGSISDVLIAILVIDKTGHFD